MKSDMRIIAKECPMCRKTHYLVLYKDKNELEAYGKYEAGEIKLIQDALPELAVGDREFLKSGYCPKCQEMLFGASNMERVINAESLINLLQDYVSKNFITNIDELCELCEQANIEPHEDVLSPMEWNCCDRCGELGISDMDFLWIDGFDWDDENEDDQKLLKALEREDEDYCAICYDCVKELKESLDEEDCCMKCGKSGHFEDGKCEHCKKERK